ncbi:MAG TPA: YaiO family outer membrane beta-barrel protein [Bacteroidales bacterium]
MNRYVVLNVLLAGLLNAMQVFSQDAINPESEYHRIKTIAFDGDYATAAAAARKLVKRYPSYGDARILLGRILAWQKDYINAGAVIDTLLLKEPGNEDALSARRNILMWSKENTPVSTDLRAGYSFDSFREPYSRFWQVFNAGGGHRFKWGPAYAGLNIGNIRIGEPSPSNASELQIEAEAWPNITSKNYADLAYAYSPGPYFPRHRAAAEVWQVLPAGWALSAGLNYYYFDRSAFIAKASVEKYLGKYWLSLKGFVCFKDNGPRTSIFLNVRRYFNDKDYLQITLGTGAAPDEPFDIQANLMRLNANTLRLAYNLSVTHKLVMRIGAGYSREEYRETIWRNRFEGNVNFIYAIKMK